MTIHNDTMILDRQIDEARAALDHEWEVLQEEEMAVRREAADAIEEIRRLTEDIAMGGSRRNRNRTHRRRTKNI